MVEQEKNIIHGHVDLEIIKQVKQAVKIPVIGNGDIKSREDAKKMFEYTNVDGIMIGRATLGNPWFLQEIITDKKIDISLKERLDTIKEHINLVIEHKGEYIGIREMRKYICWYIKNLKDSSRIREITNRIENKEELIECLEEYFKTL